MKGLMQHAELTVDRLLDYAKACHGGREIVTRLADGSIERTTYSALHANAFLDGKIAKWWMPDDVLCVAEIPLGVTGKIDKRTIRTHFADYKFPGLR
jgi:non-ribosomal peptide synthetase component E (peptide arylation enzyme)